jgi:hypothetical protein
LFGKKLVLSTLVRPWQWHALSRQLYQAEQTGAFYLHQPGHDKETLWQKYADRTMSLSEWNLGGGKSSRYLDKSWTVRLNQVSATQWDVIHALTVTHLGGQDEPLSQIWQGGFELQTFTQAPQFISATIAPGATFTPTQTVRVDQTEFFDFLEDVPPKASVNLYSPPYQDWHTKLQVRSLAQQRVQPVSGNLIVQENSAQWQGDVDLNGHALSFQVQPDTLAPFLTWHKPLPNPSDFVRQALNLTEGDVVVELHFNEPIQILGATPEALENQALRFTAEQVNITLTDRNYAVPDVVENLSPQAALLLADNTTLLLKVRPQPYQTDERYYLEISDIADRWGNMQKIENRTVITR